MCAKSLQLCPSLCDSMDVACQASLSVGFFGQQCWTGLPCPPAGDLLNSGIKPTCLMSPGGFFTNKATLGSPNNAST